MRSRRTQSCPRPYPLRAGFGLLLATLTTVFPIPSEAQRIENPKLYQKSLEAAFQAVEQFPPVEDARALERVADIGYRLAAQSSFREVPFSFYLVDMPEPNAFALPGGHIFVTRGMLSLDLDDDMLASLLGHEIAHVTARHGTRMQRRATLLNVLSQALLLGVMVGVDDSPENPRDPYGLPGSRKGSLVQGAAATGLVVSELLLRDYSRGFEDEADVEGQRLAAEAGFDPDGARKLWERMNERIPPSRNYGYWRTHPFSDQRMRAAEVRAEELKIQTPEPSADYRAQTQKAILEFADRQNDDPKLEPFLQASALTAWPRGPRAEELRLAALHRQRDLELARDELERDYGALVRAYLQQIEIVGDLEPESPFLGTLRTEMADLRAKADALFPKAIAIWHDEIYQTPFLETFLSNYPTSDVAPAVALSLGNAYSRLRRQSDAVEQYLRASEAGPDSPPGQQALQGLRNLAPVLEQMAALERLGQEIDDPELRGLARGRLAEIVGTYKDIANGAEYLRQCTACDHEEEIRERQEKLAQNLYGEVVLYQGLGDHVKALERIQKILTHASDTTAAELLRERAVLDT